MRKNYTQSWAIAALDGKQLIAGCFMDVKGGEEQAEANGELIARAVNYHTELVAMVAELLPVAELDLKLCSEFTKDKKVIKLKQGRIDRARKLISEAMR